MKPPDRDLSRYLRRVRAATWAVMTVERFWLLCLPLLLVAALFTACCWLNVFILLPPVLHGILLAVFALAAILCLSLLFRFRFPRQQDIDRRIETVSSMHFQPLGTQSDRPAGKISAPAQALWQEHRRRMADKLQDLRIGTPHAGIPRHDVHAARAVIFLLFAVAFAFSFSPRAGHIADAFFLDKRMDASLIRIDAWVTPPRYTGQPPVYLTGSTPAHSTDTLTMPQGSIVTVRIVNGDRRTRLVLRDKNRKITLAPEPDSDASDSTPVYTATLSESATLRLSTPRFDRNWSFHVVADRPPAIDWIQTPRRAINGTLELDYRIDDDFGAVSGRIETAIARSPAAPRGRALYPPPAIDLVLPRGGKGAGRTVKDLTDNPWAGAEVAMRLVVEDGAGQQAESRPVHLTLPQRSFGNPLARAVIEQRRLLALDATQRGRITDMLAALLIRPDDTISDSTQVLALQSLRTRLLLAGNDDALRNIVDYMWDVANGIENSDLTAAEQRLKQARQALRDALRNGASSEEIEKLMQELNQAVQNYISMLAQQQMNDRTAHMPENGQKLGADELEKKLKELEEMAKLGNLGAAEQLLAELEKLMDNLQVMAGGGTQAGDNKESRQGRMQKQMDALSDIMQRQQKMLDETHRLEDQHRRGEITDDEVKTKRNGLQQQQGRLQSELDRLQKELEQEGMQQGQELAEAEQSMQDSREALQHDNGVNAMQKQADALDAMRRGAQDLMAQMREAMQKAGEKSTDESVRHDPLGRAQNSKGQAGLENNSEIPGEMDVQRARRILDEIRRRLGNFTPQIEKDYLERLLKFD